MYCTTYKNKTLNTAHSVRDESRKPSNNKTKQFFHDSSSTLQGHVLRNPIHLCTKQEN